MASGTWFGETSRQRQAGPVKQQQTGISPNHVPEAVPYSLHSCSPEERASALSVLSFSWLDGLIATGVRRVLRRDDVPSPSKAMKVVNITESYEEAAEGRREKHQVWKKIRS